MIELCNESEITEAEAKEFRLPDGQGILVLKWQGEYRAYINSCPHAGWPLNFQPDTFFNLDKTLIQCSNHMAMFDPTTGSCISGPCIGEQLQTLETAVRHKKIYLKHQKRSQ